MHVVLVPETDHMNEGPTLTQVRKDIANEESKAAATEGYVALHDITPAGFISMGLDIEDEQ